MKIAWILPGGVGRDGVHGVIPHVLERLRRLGRRHEVHVFALAQEPEPSRWRLEGATVHNVGRRPRRFRALRDLRREHGRGRFDLLHASFLVPQGVVAAIAARSFGVPWVAEALGGEFVSLPDIDFGGSRNARGRFWIRVATRGAAAVLVPSATAREHAARRGVSARVLSPGLDRETWPPGEPARRTAGEPLRLLWVGSLNRVKDPRLLLDAVDRLRGLGVDVLVDVVGQDTLGGAVQREAVRRGLGDVVHFHGFRPFAVLRAFMEGAHVLVVTSRFESGPRVVLEAGAAGLPAVGTPCGFVAEWAPKAAVAVPHGDGAALAEALLRLERDEGARRALGRAARDAAEPHDADASAAELDALYARLTDAPHA